MLLNRKSIFLLEDDPVNFSVILTLLRRHGATPLHDHWGDTTLQKLKNSLELGYTLDLILLDLMLPGNVTGYDVYDAIRATPVLCDVPVVMVSAADPDQEIPVAKAKGFQGYISKPIHRVRFVEQLVKVIEGGEVWE
ncbi:MAG: response regulator [Anaerolineales bacterium]|nr:response regulator [Anaerolineales bacterium]